MNNYRKFLAILVFITLAFVSVQSYAEIFKSSEFLKWERDGQVFYIETSIGMASLIAAQNDKKQATCIDDWYYADEKRSNNHILNTMKKFPTYHPRGVILAVIEKKCGQLIYSKR